MKPIEVQFALTPDDFVAFARFVARTESANKPRTSPYVWFFLIFMGVLFLCAYVFLPRNAQAPVQAAREAVEPGWRDRLYGLGMLILLVGGATLYFFGQWINEFFLRRWLKTPEGRKQLAMRTVSINSDNVTTRSFITEIRPWEEICDIHVADNHLFLMASSRSGIIIPRRAFANHLDFECFLDAADFCRSQVN